METAKVTGDELRGAWATDRADVQEGTVRPACEAVLRRASQRKDFMTHAWRRLLAVWLRYPADTPYRRLPYL
jgi:hypothetical protein